MALPPPEEDGVSMRALPGRMETDAGVAQQVVAIGAGWQCSVSPGLDDWHLLCNAIASRFLVRTPSPWVAPLAVMRGGGRWLESAPA